MQAQTNEPLNQMANQMPNQMVDQMVDQIVDQIVDQSVASPRKGVSALDRVRALADQVAVREGCTLYDIDLVGAGAARSLRVYIDKPGDGASSFASIEDCANVSRGLNLLLDVEDVIPGGSYHLEVSTPGLERSLRQPWHFEKAVGKLVSVKTFAPLTDFNALLPQLGKAKQITGALASVSADGIHVEWAGAPADEASPPTTVFAPYASITKANVVFKFDEGSARPANPSTKSGNKSEKRKR